MMKNIIALLLISQLISISLKAQQFKNTKDSVSYSLGVLVARNLKSGGFEDIDLDLFQKGLNTTMKGDKALITAEQCQEIVQSYASEKQSKMGEQAKAAGEEYLAKNKLRPGVTTLPDGLQYEVLKAADGPKPKATDNVVVHYHGTLIDGTIFDSSVQKGEPITYLVNKFIAGWTEALQMMSVGSKWKLFVPYQLAYGERGSGSGIPPYSALIFEMELLEIK